VIDRNFCQFSFLSALLAKGNDFVLRVKAATPAVRVIERRALTPADADAGVVSDELVELTGRGAPAGRYRRVVVQTTNRRGQPEVIRLLSNLVDQSVDQSVPASVIGTIYRMRWQVELLLKRRKSIVTGATNGLFPDDIAIAIEVHNPVIVASIIGRGLITAGS